MEIWIDNWVSQKKCSRKYSKMAQKEFFTKEILNLKMAPNDNFIKDAMEDVGDKA